MIMNQLGEQKKWLKMNPKIYDEISTDPLPQVNEQVYFVDGMICYSLI